LSIESPLFVDLNGIVLAAAWRCFVLSLLEAWPIEVSQVAAFCWPSIMHIAQLVAVAVAIERDKRGIVQLSLVKYTDSTEWMAFV
jgi:hypothetical protein